MSLSTPFIKRPAGTTLITIAVGMAGALAYFLLPVSPLPQVEFPTISVSASLPGASPETMASSVATPLERQFARIAGVNEMTSSSTLGSTGITMQFDLSRNIDAAARDVQAAINAARGQLPTNLPNNPTYRKVNPADSPIMILAITSEVYDKAHMYDSASSILQQKLSQIDGVGQVSVGGGALPAVRVEVNPMLLNSMGLGLDDVRTALAAANTNRPKGQVSQGTRSWSLATTDQLFVAKDYESLIISYRNGAAVPLSNVADVVDSVEDSRTAGIADGKPAVLVIIFRQPGANIIETVDRVRAVLPQLESQIPAGMNIGVVLDRTTTIRASVRDIELTLLLSLALVVLVVFIFLRDARTTLIPSVAVPISLLGTFGVMYLCNYSLDNLSLMALTIATGFVVDDAIVVIENITRHLEEGATPMQAALKGAKEIGFTVMSISISLVAVFIPLLLMGGIVGRLLREFAVTLSVAIGVSMIVSLTTTPMMCATLLRSRSEEKQHGWIYRTNEAAFNYIHQFYRWSLSGVLRHPFITLMITLTTIAMTIYLYVVIPKGFFPQQDTGRLSGNIQADQDASFKSVSILLDRYAAIISQDPAVDGVIAFAGGSGGGGGNTPNTARMFITLKPLDVRKLNADQVIARLRGKLAPIPGATIILSAQQDISTGGRRSAALYQYSLRGDNLDELQEWAPKVLDKLKSIPGILDLNSDEQNHGLQAMLQIDRSTAARLGITPMAIDSALYDAFGQRQVSTIYRSLNQYHVVMETDPKFAQNPDALKYIYVKASDGSQVPLSAFCKYEPSTAPLSVNHQSQFPSVTFSFNLAQGFSLGEAVDRIDSAGREMGLPQSIHGSFAGTAQAFQDSLANEPYLILAAIVTVYIVLGILYESLIHPITILSTLPSAGVGALLALLMTGTDLSVIALIGIILLIGIVKKNAIMMIDFALEAERKHGKSPRDAIFEACLLRFRPITMTTMAALLGGLPLALGNGTGSELRKPLGIAIVGGLIFSQMLTLYTTPVVYLYLDRLRLWLGQELPLLIKWLFPGRRASQAMLLLICASMSLLLCSCTLGPNYERPEQHMPTTYKTATTREASTQPDITHEWWTLFGDPVLNDLETSALKGNPGLDAAMARVAEARAATRVVQADFYPVITLDPSIERARTPLQNNGTSKRNSVTVTTTHIPFDLNYEVDMWGKIRRSVESARATERASEYDLEVVLQTLEADVAQDYFAIASLVWQEQILAGTVESYREQVAVNQRGLNAGVIGPIDVAQATALLQATIADQIEVHRQREILEHALATLLGITPAELNFTAKVLDLDAPIVPAGLPSEILRHRPDVAEAEQNLVAANAQIGVAETLFYPSLSLTGMAGFESFDVQHSLDWENRAWAIGANLSAPIFEGGRLSANLEQTKAHYLELHANYRSSVLSAIADVENALTELHTRADEYQAQQLAVDAARDYLRLSQTQYRQGLTNYLTVIDAERTLQTNQLSAAQLYNQRLNATVLLIKALGGGWDSETASKPPTTMPAE